MKILIAPNCFKNSLSCFDVCSAILEGFKNISPNENYSICPLSDGGEEFQDILIKYHNACYLEKK